MPNTTPCLTRTSDCLHSAGSAVIQSPLLKSFVAGAISGTCSCVLLQPLDLLKTRLQAARFSQIYPSQHHYSGRGLIATTITIVREERFFGLWRGLRPSLARTVPGVGLYFLSLHAIQTQIGWTDLNAGRGLLVGVAARCFAGVALLPVTVVKTRFESKQYKYGSISGALKDIYQLEGFKGLYSGLTATLLRDVPFSGLYLSFYSQAKKFTLEIHGHVSMPIHFGCGVVAGIFASTITQPFDVVKTNMQLQPSRYSSVTGTVKKILETSGLTGFLTGIVPRCLRRTLMAALAWTVYEEMIVKFKLK